MCMSFTPGLGWFTDVEVVWLVLLFFFAFPPDDPPPPEEPPEGNLKFPDILLSEVFTGQGYPLSASTKGSEQPVRLAVFVPV